MATRPVPPASATIASMLSIAACVGVLIIGFLLGLSANGTPSAHDTGLTPQVRVVLKLVSYGLLGLGILGIAIGIGLLSLQNWARKAMVIGSGTTVILSVYLIYVCLALLGAPVPSGMKPTVWHALWGSCFGAFLLLLGIGVWFLIEFTRPATLASFATPGPPSVATPAAPTCPLPLALLSGFYVFGAIFSLLLLRSADRVPDMVFGHAIYGAPRNQYVLLTTGILLVAVLGLWRVKSWGMHLAVGLELFSVSNHAVNLLHPKAMDSMRSALAVMAEHGMKPPVRDPLVGFHYLEGLGLSFSLLLLAILLTSRARFLRMASAPEALP